MPSLRALHAAGHQIQLVVTQPDKPGHRMKVMSPPVKVAARELGLEVFQPERIRAPETVERLRRLAPDVLVVVAYGQILTPEVIGIPRHGAVNVHASLLPRHRGPAPIPWTILLGDDRAGVTIMQMDAGVDTGPILNQRSTALAGDETTPRLEASLAELGANLLVVTLAGLPQGEIVARRQPSEGATYARRLTGDDGDLDRAMSAAEMDRRVRSINPEPGCWITLGNGRVKVLEGYVATGRIGEPGHPIQTSSGIYLLHAVQPPGGKPMLVDAYLRGRR